MKKKPYKVPGHFVHDKGKKKVTNIKIKTKQLDQICASIIYAGLLWGRTDLEFDTSDLAAESVATVEAIKQEL